MTTSTTSATKKASNFGVAILAVAVIAAGLWLRVDETSVWRLDAATLEVRSVETGNAVAALKPGPGMASSDGTLIIPFYDKAAIGLAGYRDGQRRWATTLLPQKETNASCGVGSVFVWALPGPDGTALAQADNCGGKVRTVGLDVRSGKIRWNIADVNSYGIVPAERVVITPGARGGFTMIRNANTAPELIVVDPKSGSIRRQLQIKLPGDYWKLDADERFVTIVNPDLSGPNSLIVDFGPGELDIEPIVTTPAKGMPYAYDLADGVLFSAVVNKSTEKAEQGYTLTATELATGTVRWVNTVNSSPINLDVRALVASPFGIVVNFEDSRIRIHDRAMGTVLRTINRPTAIGDALTRPQATRQGVMISSAAVTPKRTVQFSTYNIAYDAERDEIVYQNRTSRWRRLLKRPALAEAPLGNR